MWGKIGPRDSRETRKVRKARRSSESVGHKELIDFLLVERSRLCRNSIL
jgi:hypothetical protein